MPHATRLPAKETGRGPRSLTTPWCVLVVGLLLAGCTSASDANSLPVGKVEHWILPPDGARTPAPRSVSRGHRPGEYYVLDNAGRVLVMNDQGGVLRQWHMPDYSVGKPEGVCAMSDGRIAVADTHYHRVVIFEPSGQVSHLFGSHGTEPGQFIYPVAILQSPSGDLYVCEYGGNDRVQRFRPDGTFVLQFGRFGTGPGQFQRPSGITWARDRLYVVDAFNNRIQCFSEAGELLADASADANAKLQYPYDVATGPDEALYVIEYGAGRVSRWTLERRLTGRFGTLGDGPSQFRSPWGLTVTPEGHILVADTGNRRLVMLRKP